MLSSTPYATGSIARGVCGLVASQSIVCRLLLLEEQDGGYDKAQEAVWKALSAVSSHCSVGGHSPVL